MRMDRIIATVALRLQLAPDEAADRLNTLAALLPDMPSRLGTTNPEVLAFLVYDLGGLAVLLLEMRELLPHANVSLLLCQHPNLWLAFKAPGSLCTRVQQLRDALPGVNVGALLMAEPYLLAADIHRVLDSCRRLMPHADPIHLLVSQPQMLLTATEAGLAPAPDVEGPPSHSAQGWYSP